MTITPEEREQIAGEVKGFATRANPFEFPLYFLAGSVALAVRYALYIPVSFEAAFHNPLLAASFSAGANSRRTITSARDGER